MDSKKTMMLTLAGLLWSATANVLAVDAADFEPAELRVGGATISVTFDAGKPDMSRKEWLKWITNAAGAVHAYYGHFPLTTPRPVCEISFRRSRLTGKCP